MTRRCLCIAHPNARHVLMLVALLLILSKANSRAVAQVESSDPAKNAPAASDQVMTSPPKPQPIRRNLNAQSAPTTQKASLNKTNTNSLNLPKVLLALIVVIGLILVLRWTAQRVFPGAVSSRSSSRAIQLLTRSVIAPRQQILMLQVGKRIVVVADSAGQMTSVCEITDPEEVAALIGQVEEEKHQPIRRSFGGFFSRAEQKFASDETGEETAADVETSPQPASDVSDAQERISGLSEKIRSLSRQFRG